MNHIKPGITGEAKRVVTEERTAQYLGSGQLPVFGTPALVALMENAAITALEGHLPPGQTSVGVHIDVRHLAATPVGIQVRARAELTQVDGRKLTFVIEAWDEKALIGQATHQRVVVDERQFIERTKESLG